MLLKRYENNPVLTADMVPYESTLVFNPGVIRYRGEYVMMFRNDYHYLEDSATFEGTNIGLARSSDGIHWKVDPDPVQIEEKPDMVRYYDPRLMMIDGKVYICFAMDTHHGLRGGIGVAEDPEDLHHFKVLSLSVPDNRNMVLFPEKINGKYRRLERPMPVYSRGKDRFDIWESESPDLVYWGNSSLVAGVEDFPFANDKIGPGAPPVKTDMGWLCFIHGVDLDKTRGKNGWEPKWQKRYRIGMMLLDLADPSKVIAIDPNPVLSPETDYELKKGFRLDALFPTGAVLEDDGEIKLYYGAADMVVALAAGDVDELVRECLKYRKQK